MATLSIIDSVKKTGKIFLLFIAIILFFSANPFVNIEAGHRGVVFDKLKGGIQQTTLDEGLHFRIPFLQKIVPISVRTKKIIFSNTEINANKGRLSGASSDLQDVYIDVVLTYHLDSSKIATIYQFVGEDYQNIKIIPKTISTVKTFTAKYKVGDILTKREEIKKNVFESLSKSLEKDFIILENVSLTNFDFNAQFKDSIEQKQIEEQKAQKEEYILKQKEIQVQQRIKEAEANKQAKILEGEGISEYNKLIQQEITENVLDYKQLENMRNAIEKWNGTYPSTYLGGGQNNAIPLIQIKGD